MAADKSHEEMASCAMPTEVQTDVLNEDPTLREVMRRIAEAYHPLRIYLFGSKAQGTGGPDSDYDLLVVVRDDVPLELKKSKLAYRTVWGIPKPKDVLVCTNSWFNSRTNVLPPLPRS